MAVVIESESAATPGKKVSGGRFEASNSFDYFVTYFSRNGNDR